jgi:hypothetical protein
MKTQKKEIRTDYNWPPEQCVVIDGANTSIIQFEPPHPKRRFSEAERQRYAGLSLVMRTMTSVKPFIEQIHRRAPGGAGAFQRLAELNQLIAVKGLYPWLEVDYSRLLFSQGGLPGAFCQMFFPTRASCTSPGAAPPGGVRKTMTGCLCWYTASR